MAYLCIVVVGGLAGFVLWLRERAEDRWHRRLNDLLNRKMANDFYEYHAHTEAIKKIEKMTPEQLKFAEVEALERELKERNEKSRVPDFINQFRPQGVPRGMGT